MSSAGLHLGELQRWLFERVTEPPLTFLVSTAVEAHVAGGTLSPRARVGVYRHGYVARLVECLEDDYPALQHALRPGPFADLCRDFIRVSPPQSPSLNYYGAPLASFCATRSEPWAGFAAELAALEWALVEAIHEADGELLDGNQLAQLSAEDWARARLVPSPSLRLLDTRYPVGRYYQGFRGEEASGKSLPELERSALAVCRRGADVWRVHVEPALLPLLVSLVAGAPLLQALAEADAAAQGSLRASPDALQRAFLDWVACGMFSAVALDAAAG